MKGFLKIPAAAYEVINSLLRRRLTHCPRQSMVRAGSPLSQATRERGLPSPPSLWEYTAFKATTGS